MKWSAVALLTLLLALDFGPSQAQRRGGGGGGSFGGGRSSGGFGRSGGFGGGSFGGGRSSGGSFGGGSGGYSSSGRSSRGSFGGGSGGYSSGGRSSSAPGVNNGATFGRKGSFGSSGIVSSTTTRPGYYNRTPLTTSNYYYNGSYYPAYGYGGWGSRYSYAWGSPAWYYWTPFHPAFYYSPPVYYNGVVYPGGFSWTHLLLSLLFFAVVFWIVARLLFRRGGVRYTTYN